MELNNQTKRGDLLSHEQWNEIVRRLKRMFSGPDVFVDGSGIYIRRAPGQGLQLVAFIAKIKALGPNSEADYTDERHWFNRCYIANATGADTARLTLTEYANSHPNYIYKTGSNLDRKSVV